MTYFTVYMNDDGEISIDRHSKLELEQKLSEHWWGDIKFISKLADSADPMYWGGSAMLVIKGDIMIPDAVEKVMRYELE